MLKQTHRFLIALISVLLLTVAAGAQRNVLSGQVVDVLDGKTVVVAATSGKINVELQFIDVPAKGEPMAEIVKDHLTALVKGKEIEYRIRNIATDHTVGKLMVKGVDVSQQMLRDGAAWHTPASISGQEDNDFQLYASTEAAAKTEKRGVWGVPNLLPSWQRPVTVSSSAAVPVAAEPLLKISPEARARGGWGDKNPKLGNIGALVNGYNAASRAGYLSTSLMGVKMLDDSKFDGELALDVTYFYKEGEGKAGRKGIFVFTLVCQSGKLQFLKDNELVAVFGEKKTSLGRAERTVTNDGMLNREVLRYRISRDMLERMVNTDDAFLKVGTRAVYLAQVKYLLYNMLQLAE